jgi:hypothetical protein
LFWRFFDFPSLRTHFLAFILSFGKFWRALQKILRDTARTHFPRSDAVANAIGYAKHRSRSHDAVIRVYDAAGNVIETHEHNGDQSVEDILAKIK